MKNLTLFLLFAAPLFLSAQYVEPARIFKQGQLDIQANLGIFPTYLADQQEVKIPPLQITTRYMATNNISIAMMGGYSASQSREKILRDSIRGQWSNQSFFAGTELGFHYTKIDNWDLYGGLALLYQHVRLTADSYEFRRAMEKTGIQDRRGRTTMTAFIGSRFALSPRYSVSLELGYGTSLLKVGVGYKVLGQSKDKAQRKKGKR